jgi:hypothetical protein
MKGNTIVKGNGYGGALVQDIDRTGSLYYIATLQQRNVEIVDRKPIHQVRTVEVVGELEEMLDMWFQPGTVLDGQIVIREYTEPVTDDPEEYLLWKDGKVVRTPDGKPIYRTSAYTEDFSQQDQILSGEVVV